jgi:hypothetical protein
MYRNGAAMSTRLGFADGNLPETAGWAQNAGTGALRRPAFDPDERRRRGVQVETMIAEMETAANQLDREIQAEEIRSGIHDPAHFAYPTYAKAATVRRDNLRRSIQKLKEYR